MKRTRLYRLRGKHGLTGTPSTATLADVNAAGGRAKRFAELTSEWKAKKQSLSSVTQIAMLPSYQQIIGMGPAALPLIFAELEREPDHWFWALASITGEDPVLAQHRGKIAMMARDWLGWAKAHGTATSKGGNGNDARFASPA